LALQLIDVPTGKSATCKAYTSEEIHDALKDENPCYAELKIICSPSWEQKNPVTSQPGSKSTITFAFKDYKDASVAENLLWWEWPWAFGGHFKVRGMDGRGQYPLQVDCGDKPEYISLN
jgi:hypothetical protein